MAATAGLNFRWGHSDLDQLTILDTIGHGCAFLDYDGDGRPDILLVGNAGARLYHNQGDGTFADVTEHALPKPPAQAHFLGCAVADYDGDGHPDIFLSGYGCTALYHNEGNGIFRDVTSGSGLEARGPYDWTTSAAWADVDGDGRLDLYVCRYVRFTPESRQFCGYKGLDSAGLKMACGPASYPPLQGSLYHNEGGGHFKDITRVAGMGDAHGNALGCLFCDFNGDGKPDLYIANDTRPADLYLNLGKGRFRNIAVETGTAFGADGQAMSGMGLDWGDYDNDGRFDLLVANYAGQPKSLYHNEGNQLFTNATYQSGIGAASLRPLTFGAVFLDYDNDGLLDIAFTNGHVQSRVEQVERENSYRQSAQLFRNVGGGRFTDLSAETGPDFTRKIVGRGIAVGDYDGDGRLDLLVVDDEGAPLLLHNESRTPSHWLSLRCLRAPGGPDAVGATIEVLAGGKKRIGEVRAGGSYLSTNAPEIHFGLGNAIQADEIRVRWPDGRTGVFPAVAADHCYELVPNRPTPIRLR
ncbi:MAG TPA: CRTAC1 family protein [Chthonomonadaceae bacterium]|nr:CRTAC1 family protein [Chthonomonadaceae bacterium]